jgi:hypothetical protein
MVLWVACNSLPLTDICASIPITQGFRWTVGDGLLELEQRDHIRAVIGDRGATDVTNKAKQQQQHLYKHVEFHGLFKEHKAFVSCKTQNHKHFGFYVHVSKAQLLYTPNLPPLP